MRYSGTDTGDDHEPWFRLGQLEVNTTVLIGLVWGVTLLAFAADPVTQTWLALLPGDVTSGEVWRLVTWPWAHLEFRVGEIINAAIFLFFGFTLEREMGRRAYTLLLGASILIIGVTATAFAELLGGFFLLYDLDLLTLTVVLSYIAQHPTARFFFNIPAWVIAAVIVALELVNDLAGRDWIRLLTVIVAAALIALVGRRLGLFAEFDRIPDLRLPGGEARRERKARKAAAKGGGGPRGAAGPSAPAGRPSRTARPAAPERDRSGRLWGKRESASDEPAEIIEMRPPSRRVIPSSGPEASADDLALDLLLDKISEGGMESLTDAERQTLADLRERRLR